jgi:hypothetical protein
VVSRASLIAADGARQAVTLLGQDTFRIPAGAVVDTDPVSLAVARSWRVSLDVEPLSLVRITDVDNGVRTTLTLSDQPPVTFPGALGVIGWTPARHEP